MSSHVRIVSCRIRIFLLITPYYIRIVLSCHVRICHTPKFKTIVLIGMDGLYVTLHCKWAKFRKGQRSKEIGATKLEVKISLL